MKYFEKWKNNRNLLCSNRGFTIVGSLIAFALLGVSGAGLIHYTSNIRKTSQSTVEKLEYKPILKTKIVNGMKALLIEKNIDQNGEVAKGDNVNMYGICSLVKPPTDSYGIDEVKLNLFNMQNKNSWKQKRWQAFFSPAEWEFVSNEECKTIDSTISDNNLNQCLQYRGSMGSASETVYAIAQIIPKAFPQFKTIDISNQSESLLDSKKVVFYLRVKLLSSDNIDTGYTTYMSSLADIVWANEVGECNVMAGSEKTIVKFSGTGPGTTFNRNVFNTPIFDDEIHKRKFEILGINADVVQAGGIEDFDLFSLSGENAKVSCIKNKFKCKRRILQGQSYYDDLNFVFDVMNYTPAAIPVKAINLTFKRGNVELDGRNNGILDYGTLSLSLYHSSNETIEGNKAIEFDVPRGASSFRAVNNKTLGNKNKAPLCHNVCRTYKPSQESSYVYPFISIHENKENGTVFEKDYSDDVSNRVRCTVCHMKSCHRYGLGTFGPLREEKSVVKTQNQQGKQGIIYGLADEPLDGQIPECSVDSTYDSNSSIRKLPLEAISQSALSGPADSVCKGIAMTGLNSIDAFKDFRNSQYEAVDCNTQLPVLCFVNGHYYPAIKLTHNSNAPLELVTTTFRGAQMKCFKMGQEIGRYYDLGLFLFNTYLLEDERGGNAAQNAISAVTKLPARAGSIAGFNLQSPSDLKFRFINNASRGMFFTPPAASALSLPLKKIQDLPLPPKKIQDVIKSFMSKGYTKLWTAMEWDAGGAVVASPPWALVAKDQPFSLYFNKAVGRFPVLLKDTIDKPETPLNEDDRRFLDPNPYVVSLPKDLALTHNIRWKGLVPWDYIEKLVLYVRKNQQKSFL